MEAISQSDLEFSNFNVKTQTKNLAEDCLDSIKHILPEDASIHAVLQRKAPRLFETKIGINLWHKYIFCKSTGLNPNISLQNAKRKILRQVSDLRNRKFAQKRHLTTKESNLETAQDEAMEVAATLSEIL